MEVLLLLLLQLLLRQRERGMAAELRLSLLVCPIR